MDYNNNDSLNKEAKAKIYYSVFFSLYTVFTIAAVALNLILYSLYYDSTLKLFANNFLSRMGYFLTAFAFVIALVTLFIPYFKRPALQGKTVLSTDFPVRSKGFIVFIECICGLFLVIYALNRYILNIGSLNDYKFVLIALLLVVGSLYFILQALCARVKSVFTVIPGLCLVVFIIGYIFYDLYRIDNILVNSPVRIGAILASVSIMLFILSELRFYVSRASNNIYFSAAFLTVMFALSDSLPKIYLSVMQKKGFSFDETAFFSCFEFFIGIYAFTRLCYYMADDAFSDGVTFDDDEYEYVEITEVDDGEELTGPEDESYEPDENDDSSDYEEIGDKEGNNDGESHFNSEIDSEFDLEAYRAAQEASDDLSDDGEDIREDISSNAPYKEQVSLEDQIILELNKVIPDDLKDVIEFDDSSEEGYSGEDSAGNSDKTENDENDPID